MNEKNSIDEIDVVYGKKKMKKNMVMAYLSMKI
jgi:hypothetical protein